MVEIPIEKLQILPEDLIELKKQLQLHAPGVEVWAYGSRVHGMPRRWSDIDLAIVNPPKDKRFFMAILCDEIAEGPLMLRADIIDLNQVSADFRKTVEDHHIVIQSAVKSP
ncbi:MAG: nucleotidyltransferase domain-containing protein [Candidatus Pacebacteria bacterium]|nr:nucleotidyltransferase domain-containing protein [Candidatus Paceibacterota bacterium]